MTAENILDTAIKAEGVSPDLIPLVRSIYAQESGSGKNTQTSNRGARGGMQIVPATFSSVADKDWSIDDPVDNARAGIRYLAKLHKQAGGDPMLTAAGYYGGPGGLEKARKGVAVSDPVNPKNPDTLQYAKQVVNRMGLDRPAGPAAPKPGPTETQTQLPAAQEAVGPGASETFAEAPAAVVDPEGYAPSRGGPKGADAWQSFLSTLAPVKNKPLQVADFQFGGAGGLPSVGVPLLGPPPVLNAKPRLEAFQGWKAKIA